MYVLWPINTISFSLVELKYQLTWLEIAKWLGNNWLLFLYSTFFLLAYLVVSYFVLPPLDSCLKSNFSFQNLQKKVSCSSHDMFLVCVCSDSYQTVFILNDPSHRIPAQILLLPSAQFTFYRPSITDNAVTWGTVSF